MDLQGEEGLARREAALWLHDKTLTLEHGGLPLSRYDVEYAPGATGKLAAVAGPRLFMTPFATPSLRLFAPDDLGEGGWLKALELDGYAPRRSRPRPRTLQGVLFARSTEALPMSSGGHATDPASVRRKARKPVAAF